MVAPGILEEMRSKPASCYVLSGDEPFLKDEFVASVKNMLPPGLADFNFDVFRAGVHSAEEVIARVLSYPAASDLRVVVLKDCGVLSEAEQNKILACVKAPPGHTVFLLDFEGGSAGRSFIKKLAALGREIPFRVKKRGEVAAWLKERAARAGKKLMPEALRMLQETCGDNLQMLSSELEKLIIQAGEKQEITAEDSGCPAGGAGDRTGFELGAAVSRGEAGPALRILSQITAKDAAAAEMLLGALAWHFRSVWKVRAALQRGVPQGRMASACGVPHFRVNEFARFSRRYSEEALRKIFGELLEADIRIKTRRFPVLELELLVVRLCSYYSA